MRTATAPRDCIVVTLNKLEDRVLSTVGRTAILRLGAAECCDGTGRKREFFMDYDLMVIGGGTAGMSALKTAVKLGAKVAVVEEDSFAGVCLKSG
jgi:heterodisulfide reductase subunit A-like polyferredoxin